MEYSYLEILLAELSDIILLVYTLLSIFQI